MKKNKKIIMIDDLNILMHKPDSEEIIKEDLIELTKNYIEEKNRFRFTSIYEAFRDVHTDTAFLIGYSQILDRINKLHRSNK